MTKLGHRLERTLYGGEFGYIKRIDGTLPSMYGGNLLVGEMADLARQCIAVDDENQPTPKNTIPEFPPSPRRMEEG